MVLVMDFHALMEQKDAKFQIIDTFIVFYLLCLPFNDMSFKNVPNISFQLSGECGICGFRMVILRVLLLLIRYFCLNLEIWSSI